MEFMKKMTFSEMEKAISQLQNERLVGRPAFTELNEDGFIKPESVLASKIAGKWEDYEC